MKEFYLKKLVFLSLCIICASVLHSCVRFNLLTFRKSDNKSKYIEIGGNILDYEIYDNSSILALSQYSNRYIVSNFNYKTRKTGKRLVSFFPHDEEQVVDYRRNDKNITILALQKENNMIFKRVFDYKRKKLISLEILNSTLDSNEVEFAEFTDEDFTNEERAEADNKKILKMRRFIPDYYYSSSIIEQLDDPEESTCSIFFSDKKGATLISTPLEDNKFVYKVFDKNLDFMYTQEIDPFSMVTLPEGMDVDDLEYKILDKSVQEDGTVYLSFIINLDGEMACLLGVKITKDKVSHVCNSKQYFYNPGTPEFDIDDYFSDQSIEGKMIVGDNKLNLYIYVNYDDEFAGVTHNEINFDNNSCSETKHLSIMQDLLGQYPDEVFYPGYINSIHALENGNTLIEFERNNIERETYGGSNVSYVYEMNKKGGLSLLMIDKDHKQQWHTFLRNPIKLMAYSLPWKIPLLSKPNTNTLNSDIKIEKDKIIATINTNLVKGQAKIVKCKIDVKTGKIEKKTVLRKAHRLANISIPGIIKLSNGRYLTTGISPGYGAVSSQVIIFKAGR